MFFLRRITIKIKKKLRKKSFWTCFFFLEHPVLIYTSWSVAASPRQEGQISKFDIKVCFMPKIISLIEQRVVIFKVLTIFSFQSKRLFFKSQLYIKKSKQWQKMFYIERILFQNASENQPNIKPIVFDRIRMSFFINLTLQCSISQAQKCKILS